MKFGTDGIRGVPGSDYQLEDIVRLGFFSAQLLSKKKKKLCLIGEDTRLSSPALGAAFASGALAQGWTVCSAGVLPTPAIAFLCRKEKIPLGVMISASHNPPQDNGIKLFQEQGMKWQERRERELEALLKEGRVQNFRQGGNWQAGIEESLQAYLKHLYKWFPQLAFPEKIVFDCAYGAVGKVVPQIVKHYRLPAKIIFGEPKGEKINQKCGALYPQKLSQTVRQTGSAVGFSFDGDGDRVLVCDDSGKVLDGDALLALFAQHFLEKKKLRKKTIVVTVMSNQSLVLYLDKLGIKVVRTPVGDRKVLAKLKEHNLVLGGEQAGHILFPEANCSSDGLFTALTLLSILQETKTSAADWADLFDPFPQQTKSYLVANKTGLMHKQKLKTLTQNAGRKVGRWGRVLVRPSGTEPKIRVMIETDDRAVLEQLFARFDEFFASV